MTTYYFDIESYAAVPNPIAALIVYYLRESSIFQDSIRDRWSFSRSMTEAAKEINLSVISVSDNAFNIDLTDADIEQLEKRSTMMRLHEDISFVEIIDQFQILYRCVREWPGMN